MGTDDTEYEGEFLYWLIVIILALIVFLLSIILVILILIGFFTIKAWSYETYWGKKNARLTSFFIGEREWKDYVLPAIVWASIGFCIAVLTDFITKVIYSLFSLLSTWGIFISLVENSNDAFFLVIFLLLMLGPFPYRFYNRDTREPIYLGPRDFDHTISSDFHGHYQSNDNAGNRLNNPFNSNSNFRMSHTCYYCGAITSLSTCPSCQKQSIRCEICKRPISFGDQVAKCRFCERVFHLMHLKESVKVYGKCPTCQRHMTEAGVIPISPIGRGKKRIRNLSSSFSVN